MLINEDNYVDVAQKVINNLKNRKELVTRSKIRSLLAMVSDIYNEVLRLPNDKLPQSIIEKINYLKIRFYYEAVREPNTKSLLWEADIIKNIDEIGTDRKKYILFSHYIEALVAFHRYYGGREL